MNYLKSRISQHGFTIVELLVVVAVAGMLLALVVANYRESKISSRNAKRLQDIREIQNALDLYHTNNRSYPGTADVPGPVTTELTALVNDGYIKALPSDSLGGNFNYMYCPSDSVGGPQVYTLRAKLELEKGANPAALSKDIDGTSYECDCADSNQYYCVGS